MTGKRSAVRTLVCCSPISSHAKKREKIESVGEEVSTFLSELARRFERRSFFESPGFYKKFFAFSSEKSYKSRLFDRPVRSCQTGLDDSFRI
jgi:hypothetical protein